MAISGLLSKWLRFAQIIGLSQVAITGTTAIQKISHLY